MHSLCWSMCVYSLSKTYFPSSVSMRSLTVARETNSCWPSQALLQALMGPLCALRETIHLAGFPLESRISNNRDCSLNSSSSGARRRKNSLPGRSGMPVTVSWLTVGNRLISGTALAEKQHNIYALKSVLK